MTHKNIMHKRMMHKKMTQKKRRQKAVEKNHEVKRIGFSSISWNLINIFNPVFEILLYFNLI